MPLPARPVPALGPHWQQLLHIGAGGSQLLVSNLHVTLEPFPCACFCCHREMCPVVVAKCHCSLWVGACSWPTKPDLPPRASTKGGEGTGSLPGSASDLCRQQLLCPRFLGKRPGKLSRASFKVACVLQPYTMEDMGSRSTAAKLRLGPGGCEASPVLCGK